MEYLPGVFRGRPRGHRVNGVIIGIGSNAHPNIGYVCLQSEGAPAEFRNIRIRRHAPTHHLWRKGEPPPGGLKR